MTKTPDPTRAPADPELTNEGEGSRSAVRRYNKGAAQTAKTLHVVESHAQEAQKAIEGPEGQKLREAEVRGKEHQHR
jgi:hypothetical protein